MPWLYCCILRDHIHRHLLGSWRLFYLLVILYLWPIGGYLYRYVGLVCARNGGVVGPTYLPFLEGGVFKSGITLLGGWYARPGKVWQKRYYKLSVFIFVEYRNALMSCTHDVSFSLDMYEDILLWWAWCYTTKGERYNLLGTYNVD